MKKVEFTKKDRSKKKKKKNKGLDPSPLLLSLASYLQHQGFTNTLAAFQSEASIGQLDDSKAHGLDLEMFYKYLETSKSDTKSNKNVPEELGLTNAGVIEEDREKSKSTAETAPTDNTAHESQLHASEGKSKDKKRKKSKIADTVENGGSETCILEGKSVAEKSSTDIQPDGENVKPKNKKKKNKSLEPASENDRKEFDKKSSKKRKRMVSEGNESQPDLNIKTNGPKENVGALEDDTVNKDKTSSKKRKKMITEGNGIQPDVDKKKAVPLSQNDGVQENELMEEEKNTDKRNTSANGQADSKKLQETSLDEKISVFSEGKKTPKGSETPIEGVFHAKGDVEKNGRAGTGSQKSMKKQQNGSSEGLTLEAVLNGNAGKKLFFKFQGRQCRFGPPLMKFCSSYLQEAISLHKRGLCIDFKGEFCSNIIFERNLFDRVKFAHPPKRLPLNGKCDDYKELGDFLSGLLKSYNCEISTEIKNFIDLLKAPKPNKVLILNHYSLWNSGKRMNFLEKMHHLYEKPKVEEDPMHPGHVDIDKLETAFYEIVKPHFESESLLKDCIGDAVFWKVWGEDIVMKDNYQYYGRKQARIEAANKKRAQSKQAAAMEAAAMKAGSSRKKPPNKRPLPSSTNPTQKKAANYDSYKNNVAGLLRFTRNVFEHYKFDSEGKSYALVDLEWRFYLYFPDFISLICGILSSHHLYPRLS